MPTKLQMRRGTSVEWAASNPILADGEKAFDKTSRRWKTGNGVDAWNDLLWDVLAEDGPPGPSGTIEAVTIEMLNAGDEAEVEVTGAPSARSINLKIPIGVKGDSNYQLWLDDGNVGTVADYLKMLQADAFHSIDGFFERLSAPIIPQNYPAGAALPSEFTATFFHAEILNGDTGSKCDITIMAVGRNYYGPVTVEHGSPNSASGVSLAVIPKGLSPSVRIDKIVGNVHVVGVTLSGVLK